MHSRCHFDLYDQTPLQLFVVLYYYTINVITSDVTSRQQTLL